LIFNMADLVPSPGQPPLQMKFQKIKDTGGHDHYVAATTPDIGTGSGGGGCEPYDSTKIYSAKSMVLVQTGTHAGMWCVAPGKTAAAGQAPVFPVPADPTWLLLALGVQFTSVCANGTKTVAVNMSSPF